MHRTRSRRINPLDRGPRPAGRPPRLSAGGRVDPLPARPDSASPTTGATGGRSGRPRSTRVTPARWEDRPRRPHRASWTTTLPMVLLAATGCATPVGPAPAPPDVRPSDAGPAPTVAIPEPEPIEAGVAPPPGPYAPGVDVLHYDLEVTLPDTTSRRFRGTARIRMFLTDPAPDTVALDLTGLAVVGTSVEGEAVAPALRSGKLLVPLPSGSAAGDTVDVEVRYLGAPDDGLLLRENVHGARTAFADNWPNRARFWFPGVDHPSDKATVHFLVHAPPSWEVVANGRLLEDPPRDDGPEGLRSWEWASDVPLPTYTMVVGAAPFARRSVGRAACGLAPRSPREDGCVEITTWVFPPDTAHAATVFRRSPEMVDFFAQLVGPFPYEKLAHVQSSTRFGGMENASAIFYSEEALAAGRDIEGTVSHEVAHQWFGDSVTESEWHHLWLSEGFATYFGNLFFEAADGPVAFRERMEEARQRYLASDVVDRPVIDPEVADLFALLNANNYQKGAWVLHMLRGVVGDEAFFQGVRTYYERHADGTALTDDFRRAVEESSGQELGWFFEQWLFRPGHPIFAVDWSWDDGTERLSVVVRQEQPERWPLFRVPATLRLRLPGAVRDERIEIREREQTFTFDLPARPTAVVLDPEGWILEETSSRN